MARTLKKDQLNFLSKLGDNIVRIRKEKGLTQVELGYRMNTDKANIRKIEAGRANVTVLTLLKLSELLETDISEFLRS